MATGVLDRPMAKKRGRPESGRNDISVRMDADVVKNAKIVASYEGKTLAEYLSDSMAPIVARDMRKHATRVLRPDDQS